MSWVEGLEALLIWLGFVAACAGVLWLLIHCTDENGN